MPSTWCPWPAAPENGFNKGFGLTVGCLHGVWGGVKAVMIEQNVWRGQEELKNHKTQKQNCTRAHLSHLPSNIIHHPKIWSQVGHLTPLVDQIDTF